MIIHYPAYFFSILWVFFLLEEFQRFKLSLKLHVGSHNVACLPGNHLFTTAFPEVPGLLLYSQDSEELSEVQQRSCTSRIRIKRFIARNCFEQLWGLAKQIQNPDKARILGHEWKVLFTGEICSLSGKSWQWF